MNTLSGMLWRALFDEDLPPELITLTLPSKSDRQHLLDEIRNSIDDRERTIRQLELATGISNPITSEMPWAGLGA